MNICLVNNLYPPINTGSSFYTGGLAKNLAERGHKVIVITNQIESRGFLENEGNVKVYRLPVFKLPEFDIWMKFPHFNFSIFPSNLRKIRKIMEQEKVEIIHQCNNIFDLIFASAWVSRRSRVPLLCSIMTQIQHTNKAYNKILEIFDKTFIKFLFSRQVTQYLALDRESQRYIYERFCLKKNVTFTPFSIPKEDVEFAYQNRKSDYEKTHFRAISVGHVSNLKNRFEIIKAWANVVKKYPNAKLVIIGGIFSERSAILIKELKLVNNIEFTGRVPHQEVFEYMKSSDFSCMFLSAELPFAQGVGAANLETMAFGLPAVLDATEDFFGERFPFRSREHFIMAKNRDPQALSAKFIELFENPQLRKKVGMGGQKFVRETLDMDKVMDEMELIYKKVRASSQYRGVHAPLR